MKKNILLMFLFFCLVTRAQESPDKVKIKEDLEHLLNYISHYYVYLPERGIDINCLREYYSKKIDNVNTNEDTVLLFEYLMDEFHDSHLMLNTNVWDSYRLYSPLYVSQKNNKTIITSVWTSSKEGILENIVGAEVIEVNKIMMPLAIDNFPTHCDDKANPVTREWIANKVISGRYSQPRILTLRLTSGKIINFDLDQVKISQHKSLISTEIKNNIGIITINNSLGNNDLISEFDKALDSLVSTKGLIIDLRNTVDGGNSYVARGIMSRFVRNEMPYQKHSFIEQYGNGPAVERTWLEYVNPRISRYTKPSVVLVSRWTGSMGEGLAIGLESAASSTIVGTEMERLAGEMNGFSFKNLQYGFRLSTARLFHVNGTPREKYIPANYVAMTSCLIDETMEKAIEIINRKNK